MKDIIRALVMNEIGNCEDDIYRAKLQLPRAESEKDRTEIASYISSCEARKSELEEALNGDPQ